MTLSLLRKAWDSHATMAGPVCRVRVQGSCALCRVPVQCAGSLCRAPAHCTGSCTLCRDPVQCAGALCSVQGPCAVCSAHWVIPIRTQTRQKEYKESNLVRCQQTLINVRFKASTKHIGVVDITMHVHPSSEPLKP
jgi:hypothetical protein